MLIDIAISSIIKGSVLLALVLLFVQQTNSNTAAVKHNKLAAALMVLLILPLLEIAPKLSLQILPSSSELALDGASHWLSLSPNTALLVCTVYLFGVLLGLCRVILDFVALQRQLRSASECNIDVLPRDIKQYLRESPKGISFLQLEHLRSPITVGAIKQKVVLPSNFLRQPTKVVSAAIQHELAHVRRHDWAIQLLTRVIVALFWFNPLVHVCARGLRNQAEIAADDEVVLAGIGAPQYAGVLLGYARQQRKRQEPETRPPLWAAMLGPGLADRVHALTQRTPRRYYDGFGLTESLVAFLILLLPFTVLEAVPKAEPQQLVALSDHTLVSESPYGPFVYAHPPAPVIDQPVKPLPPPAIQSAHWSVGSVANPTTQKVLVQGPVPSKSIKALAAVTPSISRSGFMPAVSVMPAYPRKAINRNLEGFVDVVFDIQRDGSVENARVLRSEPGRIFDRAALNAIRKSRYEPHQLNGTTVTVQDVENRYVFRLKESNQNSEPQDKPASQTSEVLIAQGVRYDHL